MPLDEGVPRGYTVASYAEYAPALFRGNRWFTHAHSTPHLSSLVAPFARTTAVPTTPFWTSSSRSSPYVWFPFSLLTKIWSSGRVKDRDVGTWVRAKLLAKWAGWETYDIHDIHTERCGRAGKCIIVGIPGAALKGKDIPRNGSNTAGTELDARARIAAHLAAAAKGEYAGGVVAAMADEDEDEDTDDDEEIVLEKETAGRSTPARPVLKLQKTRISRTKQLCRGIRLWFACVF